MIINFIRGFCMALADSVPGVSGGTVAFLLGFYDKFIQSLNDIFAGNKAQRLEAVKFLAKLLVGWLVGFCSAVLVLTSVFESHIYAISSLFLGFIIVAIPYVIAEEKETIKGKWAHLIFTVIGIALVVVISFLNPVSGKGISIDAGSLNFGLIIYVFIAAAVAITAMILPGISGSTLLLIFGLYVPIISAIKEVLRFNFEYVPVLIVFGLGIITGIVSMIRLLKMALKKFRSQTIYAIIGLMLGSLYAIIVGPTTLDEPQAAMTLSTFSPLFFVIGGVIIVGLQLLRNVLEKNSKE